jgi:hypothetical protein
VGHAVDLNGGNGGTAEAGEDHAAQAVAEGHTIARIQRLDCERGFVALLVNRLKLRELNRM